MEHWEKIVLGVFFGTLLTSAFFFVFDKLLQTFRSKSPAPPQNYIPIPLGRFKKQQEDHVHGQRISRGDMEKLIYEEFKTEQHEVVCLITHNGHACIGICAFLNDLKVEYFMENFSECCVEQCNNLSVRSVLSAVSQWSDSWMGAERVTLLTSGRDLVNAFNTSGTRENEMLRKYEEKFMFKANVQFKDNFICHEVEFQELWDDLNDLGNDILGSGDRDELWEDFLLSHWDRNKITLSEEHLHRVPHTGKVLATQPDQKKLIEI